MPLWTAGIVLYVVLALPVSRALLESGMAGHMLVQLPLLALSGYWTASGLPKRVREGVQRWNAYGITGAMIALFTALFWMLPRSLDAAVDSAAYEIIKFLILPLLLGMPLQLSWHPLTAIGRGLLWSNFVAMLWVLAWLYLAAPVRVCNSYLLDEQTLVGWLLFGIGCLIAAGLTVRAFVGAGSDEAARPRWR